MQWVVCAHVLPHSLAIRNSPFLVLFFLFRPLSFFFPRLYKLHGLNQEFKCEICGNESYWGRRAYERHFREPKHQHGLRCLKIPNSKAFLEVTTIKDAVALAAALAEKGARAFRGDADEEFEDAQGNVYNKTTYALLQRQGLL